MTKRASETIFQDVTSLVTIPALSSRIVSKLMTMKFTIFTKSDLISRSWMSGCKSNIRGQRGDDAKSFFLK